MPSPPRTTPPPVGDSLDRIADEVARCRACPRLVTWREEVAITKRAAYADQEYWGRGVPAFGDPDAGLVIVGLAPAAHGANRTGRMFTGDRSGEWLFRALHRAGLADRPVSLAPGDGLRLRHTLITAPVKCAPPANKPTVDERDRCRPFLARELAVVPARVFVALGAFGYQAVCNHLGIRPRPRFGHGVEAVDDRGRVVVASYHVSQQNTFTGRLTEEMLDAVFTRTRQLLELPPAH